MAREMPAAPPSYHHTGESDGAVMLCESGHQSFSSEERVCWPSIIPPRLRLQESGYRHVLCRRFLAGEGAKTSITTTMTEDFNDGIDGTTEPVEKKQVTYHTRPGSEKSLYQPTPWYKQPLQIIPLALLVLLALTWIFTVLFKTDVCKSIDRTTYEWKGETLTALDSKKDGTLCALSVAEEKWYRASEIIKQSQTLQAQQAQQQQQIPTE